MATQHCPSEDLGNTGQPLCIEEAFGLEDPEGMPEEERWVLKHINSFVHLDPTSTGVGQLCVYNRTSDIKLVKKTIDKFGRTRVVSWNVFFRAMK